VRSYGSFGPTLWFVVAVIASGGATGCSAELESNLNRLEEANRLATDLLVQFNKSGDAGNRAVMADTNEASLAFVGEAEQATGAVQKDAGALRPLLSNLMYSNEIRLLDEFTARFGQYHALDRSILDLAVENTNVKAQRLSFGPVLEAADAFQTSIEAVQPATSAADSLRAAALVATAIAAVREIQALQAPHIAEPDDEAMTRIEKRMVTAEASARGAIQKLSNVLPPTSRPRLVAATAALDRFVDLHKEVIALSRRNTNVRSLALSLGKKRMLAGACEESLRALQEALSKRGFSATR